MTRLEALNKILEASKAGLLGADGRDSCVYWQPEENKNCAIGCLFPVEILQQLIDDNFNEQTNVEDLPGYAAELIPFTLEEADGLQNLHDRCYGNDDPEDFRREIERLIEEYDPLKELDL